MPAPQKKPRNDEIQGFHDAAVPSRIRDTLEVLMKSQQVAPFDRACRVVASWRQRLEKGMVEGTLLTIHEEVDIHVSDRIPQSVYDVLRSLDPAYVWLLLNNERGNTCRGFLNDASTEFGNHGEVSSRLASAASTVADALVEAHCHADEAIRRIMNARDADVLGSYSCPFGGKPTIRIYWLVIWIVSQQLEVPFEALVVVTLAHELAHAYSHLAKNANAQKWTDQKYAAADTFVAEGLAQFFALQTMQRAYKEDVNYDPVAAFERLIRKQPEPYKWFTSWPAEHTRDNERVREALLLVRELEDATADDWLRQLADATPRTAKKGGAA